MRRSSNASPLGTCTGCGHPRMPAEDRCPECGGRAVRTFLSEQARQDRRGLARLRWMWVAGSLCGLVILLTNGLALQQVLSGPIGKLQRHSLLPAGIVGLVAAVVLIGLSFVQEVFVTRLYRSVDLRRTRRPTRELPFLLSILTLTMVPLVQVGLFMKSGPDRIAAGLLGIVGFVVLLAGQVTAVGIGWSRYANLLPLIAGRRRGGFEHRASSDRPSRSPGGSSR